jgi:hypothetical protein
MAKKATTPKVTPTATVPPTPTVRIRATMVCVPEDVSTQVLTSTRNLDKHLGVPATSWARMWAKPSMYWWQRQNMIGLRKGRPAYCAGGPVRLLDLAGMRHGAAVGAAIRHQQWTAAVHGTRPATPWHVFEARHLADPSKYTMDQAKADFDAQPRVSAMRLHNTTTYGTGELDPKDLEVFQAGPAAYAHFWAAWAVCTDALVTEQGHRIQPESDSLAHRITYLDKALRYIENLDNEQRLLAVTV